MTRSQAITKATAKAERYAKPYLVTSRTAHPFYPNQTTYLIVAESEKRLWAADEWLVLHTEHPDDLTEAWYAVGCPPSPNSPTFMTFDEMREQARRVLGAMTR